MKKSTIFLIRLVFVLSIAIIFLFIIRKYTLGSDIIFLSDVYSIGDGYIENISSNTSVDLYEKYFDLDNCYIEVVDSDGNYITTDYVYTGSYTVVYNMNGVSIASYINIVVGDISGDGIVGDDDLSILASIIFEEEEVADYYIRAVDFSLDNQLKINDLTLFEDYLNSSYESISLNYEELTMMTNQNVRIIATIEPSIVLNLNAIWSSSDSSIVEVDQSGMLNPKKEGSVVITASTSDEELMAQVYVTVDNTPTLSSNSGKVYINGDDLEVTISAVSYDDLSCVVDNESYASCSISDNILSIHAISSGTTVVTVSSQEYGDVSMDLEVLFTYLTIYPKSTCVKIRSSISGGTVSSFNAGTLTVDSISDTSIITSAYINTKGFGMSAGTKTGDAIITFKESNGNQTVNFTAYVYNLALSTSMGTTTVGGENLTSVISAENTGDLSCTSNDESVVSCEISDDVLTVVPISVGETTVTVKGKNCGSVNYKAVVTSEVTE